MATVLHPPFEVADVAHVLRAHGAQPDPSRDWARRPARYGRVRGNFLPGGWQWSPLDGFLAALIATAAFAATCLLVLAGSSTTAVFWAAVFAFVSFALEIHVFSRLP